MPYILTLALRSLNNRRTTALMIIFSIAVSVALLLGVEKIRHGVKQSFASTVSGTDLIVGARSGSVQLLLYSVFRIGNATNNISWQSYQKISQYPQVKWSIPLSLGDSHKGYRVLGTSQEYFKFYRFSRNKPLEFTKGAQFNHLYDVVLGAEVAKQLDYKIGDKIIVAHGMGNTSFSKHEDQPFSVTGILKPTGTPVDQTLHISLEAIEAIHIDWQAGVHLPGSGGKKSSAKQQLQPKQITAFMLGLKSKFATFQLQRGISNFRAEPLQAILPGVALQELWGMISIAEKALLLISTIVVASGLFCMITVLLTGLNERRRELAILRSVGAHPWQILTLIMLETALLTVLGIISALLILYGALYLGVSILEDNYGLHIELTTLTLYELQLLAIVICAGTLAGLIPGIKAYRYSLGDGMTIRN